MTEQFNDGATTTVAQGGGIDGSSNPVTFTVASLLNFPTTGTFAIEIDNEVMMVTAVNAGAVTMTASRGSSATGETPTPSLATHNNGAVVKHVLSSGSIARALVRLDTAASQSLTGPLVIPPTLGGTAATTSYGSVAIKLAEQVLVAPAASVTFSSIPQSFRNLRGTASQMQDSSVATAINSLKMVINSDTTVSHYYQNMINAQGSTLTAIETLGTLGYFLPGLVMNGGVGAGKRGGFGRFEIPNYASAVDDFQMLAHATGMLTGAAGQNFQRQIAGLYLNTGVGVTSLTFSEDAANNLAAGCILALYGEP